MILEAENFVIEQRVLTFKRDVIIANIETRVT